MEEQSDVAGYMEPGGKNATLVYILYLVNIIVPFTAIVGVIFAYLNRGKSTGWVESHYTYQIRTFWIGLLFGIVSALLTIVLIGFLMIIAVLIWMIVRCIKGLQLAGRNEPVPNPETWMF
ncbi:hypothetical protein K1718_23170 [Roseibium porphyridii]|uniref:DUF4870 domain-containing protein n=1 Tax=Roseibium porphyridii TaxID=2866279 RepID=A0ABY8F2L4_9HYPH|nr:MULTISPECIES: DUF4870 domain-containing protein [Stappiaceae]QFT33776.1 hypothetical protein FIV00_24995 [Labrenzia sp. THAF82]WFE89029.1 hypothetical protein K1718_23170 [Roseibium sp. KMA01]